MHISVFQHVDQAVLMRFVERHAVVKAKVMQARGTVNPGREKIVRAIQRLQIMSVEIDERFQRLATLQSAKDITEQRPQVVGLDRIEEGPHLGVTVDAVDGAEVNPFVSHYA